MLLEDLSQELIKRVLPEQGELLEYLIAGEIQIDRRYLDVRNLPKLSVVREHYSLGIFWEQYHEVVDDLVELQAGFIYLLV